MDRELRSSLFNFQWLKVKYIDFLRIIIFDIDNDFIA